MSMNHQPVTVRRAVITPEKALKSYLTGRWILFILLGSLPALLLIPDGGIGLLLLTLLAAPGYVAFRGINVIKSKAHHLQGHNGYTELLITMGAIVLACIASPVVEFISSGQDTSLPYLRSLVFIAGTAWAIKELQIAHRINPAATEDSTRTAAKVATGICAFLLMAGIISTFLFLAIFFFLLAFPVLLVFMAFLVAHPFLTLIAITIVPASVGTAALVLALRNRRRHRIVMEKDPNAPTPIVNLKETIQYSIFASSAVFVIATWVILLMAVGGAYELHPDLMPNKNG